LSKKVKYSEKYLYDRVGTSQLLKWINHLLALLLSESASFDGLILN